MTDKLEDRWMEMTAGTYNVIQEVLKQDKYKEIKSKTKLDNPHSFKVLCELYTGKGYLNACDLLKLGEEAISGLEALYYTKIMESDGEIRLSEIGYALTNEIDDKLKERLNKRLVDYLRSNN